MKSNHNGTPVHDVSRRNLVDVLRNSRAIRAIVFMTATSLALSGCSAPANSAPNKTTEVSAPAKPGVEPEATQLDREVSSPFGKEMQGYVDAANQNDKAFVMDKLREQSAVERTAKPEALEAALSFRDIKIEEEPLEGRKLSELGIELGNHPILQKDGVSMADLYAGFTIVKDPKKDRNAWFDGLSEDAFATYFSQKAAVDNAPFGEETTKALKVLYETDPNNIGLALPMVIRELAHAAASTNDSEIVMALLKEMAAEGFKPQIDKVVRIINQPEGQENDPVDINPSQIFIKGEGKVHAGSIKAKASVSPPVADDQYPGGVDYALHTRTHGIAPDGKLAAASKIVASFHVDTDEYGRVTMVEQERGRMEYPLPKVPKPNNTETDPNKIG